MGEFMSSEEGQASVLLVCSYCDKYKNDDGYWEHLSIFLKSLMEDRLSHGICPQCLKKHFPDQYASLCKAGKIIIKGIISPENKMLHGCFLIVNNIGCLNGEHDRDQRN